ncbi:hypothetical protein [Parabacteroides sp. PF5-6]|uniref:hypothetical protein n=1 Tax=Parabacteroides sp. PF5-6 TaxID=1742403 RepID=UPI0024053525|nr:hypothetical protein [Parabacteroides sp. PF5-6]MDF9828774.1 hypothetical protein [Parabacteroides sp. PF5-6]
MTQTKAQCFVRQSAMFFFLDFRGIQEAVNQSIIKSRYLLTIVNKCVDGYQQANSPGKKKK